MAQAAYWALVLALALALMLAAVWGLREEEAAELSAPSSSLPFDPNHN